MEQQGSAGEVKKKIALVAGATGVVGRNLTLMLDRLDDWDAISLGRAQRDYKTTKSTTNICIDLLDRKGLEEALQPYNNITHIFYVAYVEKRHPYEAIEPNLKMLENVVNVVEKISPVLQHVSLCEGTNWYGVELGPIKTPAKENDQRHMPPNFYYNQEDFVREKVAQGAKWTWSAVRPPSVCGFATGNPNNLVTVIAVYAAICKELGLPLRWPGSIGAYRSVFEVVDVDVLAKMMIWAATEPKCANEAFNCTNGDVFRWENVWPDIAKTVGLEVGPPVQLCLTEMMPDKRHLWETMIAKYELCPIPYDKIVAWPYGDRVFSGDYDAFSDVNKARRFGFHEMVVDTHEMFVRMIGQLQEQKVIPKFQ